MIAATGQGLTAEVLIEEALGAAVEDPVAEVAKRMLKQDQEKNRCY